VKGLGKDQGDVVREMASIHFGYGDRWGVDVGWGEALTLEQQGILGNGILETSQIAMVGLGCQVASDD
jgi:hypothetical protein